MLVVTADHGNADCMFDETGKGQHRPHHQPRPLRRVRKKGLELKNGGKLADIAPTILRIMGLPQPAEMTGECLIK